MTLKEGRMIKGGITNPPKTEKPKNFIYPSQAGGNVEKYKQYRINWERVQSIYDIKRILKVLDITLYDDTVKGIEDIVEEVGIENNMDAVDSRQGEFLRQDGP